MGFNVDFVKVKMLLKDARDVKVNGIVRGNVKSKIGKTTKHFVRLFMKN